MAFSPYSTWTPKLTASSPLHTSSSPTLREEIQPTTPKSPSMENVSNFNDRFRSWSTVNATKSGNGFTSLKSEDPISVPPRKPVSSVPFRCLSLVSYLIDVAAFRCRCQAQKSLSSPSSQPPFLPSSVFLVKPARTLHISGHIRQGCFHISR